MPMMEMFAAFAGCFSLRTPAFLCARLCLMKASRKGTGRKKEDRSSGVQEYRIQNLANAECPANGERLTFSRWGATLLTEGSRSPESSG